MLLAENPCMMRKERTFTGLGGRLTLTPEGSLYGVGWDLVIPYGVDYDLAAALAAEPVKIAGDVVSAAAGYNYGLYVTSDGTLRFVGGSGIPYAERFAFGRGIREVFARPDRDVFRLTDEAGESWVWGDNLSGALQETERTPRAVLDGQTLTQRQGRAVWRCQLDGRERRCKGLLLEVPGWETLGKLRRRVSESEEYRRLSAEYGENNLLLKYIRQDLSPYRDIRSENWSEEEYNGMEECPNAIPRQPGVRDLCLEAFCGRERDVTYTVGIYTINRYLFQPIKNEGMKT